MTPQDQSITSLQKDSLAFPPPQALAAKAYIGTFEKYKAMYERSLKDSHGFWLEQALQELQWFKKPTQTLEYTWDTPKRMVQHTWFADGELNVSVNCLDRHLTGPTKDKVAILWQGEKDEEVRSLTYAELHKLVCQFSNVLLSKGIKKGDRVCVYMPMVPEAAVALLACARIGAIHSVVFAGFSAESLKSRIQDSDNVAIVTADVGFRAGRTIALKNIVDESLKECPMIKNVIVFQRGDGKVEMRAGRDHWWHEEMKNASPEHRAEPMKAEDPLFILYTSGSTGKPKGVLHTTAGYLLWVAMTHRYIFDYHPQDLYWCTADIGWVTGHSYIVYGPLANGATSMMFEGVPNYPDPGRFWQVVSKHKVNIFYTAPTAIRALMREGEDWPRKYDLSSLKILGSVGEPINPEAWLWYHRNVGRGNCPIVDTWWQTETGGFMITPLPGSSYAQTRQRLQAFFWG